MFYYRKKQMWIFDDNDKQAARMVSVIDFLMVLEQPSYRRR